MRRVITFLSFVLIAYIITLSLFLPEAIAKAAAYKSKNENVKARLARAKGTRVLGLKTVSEVPFFIPTNTPFPTRTPTPTATPAPAEKKSVQVSRSGEVNSQVQTSDTEAYLLNAVNDYRKSHGLAPVTTNSATCDFARKRVGELSSNFSHDGFKPYPYPSFSKVTENIAMNSNYRDVVPKWIASPGHAENMRADTPFVCIAKNGNYYAYEGWKP